MNQEFTAVIKKQGKWYLGWIEEVPGVNTQGKTLREVRENIKDALALIIDANKHYLASCTRGKVIRESVILP
ncbi:MAG: type II toxin-antitoxin system HicB family antitoxin [bacterium]|nr:type II toxin-antitoxin system HicB family antitoxin [bacterium]